ncbi:hypothetical protein LCGC14_1333120 [marine sediment metagenome]|uniref:Uncharacterized protein n=1 Tax=marine sediment metagenome TaxID=412755 RepID=A0A0F9NIE3_9ZZZZ
MSETTPEERKAFMHPAKYSSGHIIRRLIADVEQAENQLAEANRLAVALNADGVALEDQLAEAAGMLRRMHGQYHAILGLAPPPRECVNACKPAATFLASLEPHG